MLSLAMARSFCDNNAVRYLGLLLVLWMTSYFHIMERVGQNQRRRVCLVQFARWRHRVRSLPSLFVGVLESGKSADDVVQAKTKSLTMSIIVAVIVAVLLLSPLITGYVWWFKVHRVREKPDTEIQRMYI